VAKSDYEQIVASLRSDDVLTQNEGVEAAIQTGSGAVPELLRLLDEPGFPRDQVLYALAQIGDPRAVDAFLAGLEDPNERVRSRAASGLAKLGHPQALAACLKTLNDAPDALHLDVTPSVRALARMGLPAAAALRDLLTDPDENTRLHAERALEMMKAPHKTETAQG